MSKSANNTLKEGIVASEVRFMAFFSKNIKHPAAGGKESISWAHQFIEALLFVNYLEISF